MSGDRIYLDYNACAPVRPEARSAMVHWLGQPGNASSVHKEGRSGRQIIESARECLGENLGVGPQNVTFASGGTEANVTALSPIWKVNEQEIGFERLLVSASEHPSVLAGGRFSADRVDVVPVDENGQIDLPELDRRLANCDGPVLVSVMVANNETGVLQPVTDVAKLVHARGGNVHTDAIQAFGKIPFVLDELGADVITVSGHKIGGPQGVGAIVARDGVAIPSLVRGGGQENHRRAGTENVAAIAGLAAVLSGIESIREEFIEIRRLRDWFEEKLTHMAPCSVVFGQNVDRLGNTSCFAIPGVRAETAMIFFDLSGIAVSSGSACSSGKVSASHVLRAMDVDDDLASGAIRVSLGWATTEDEISTFLQAVRAVCKNQRPQGHIKAA